MKSPRHALLPAVLSAAAFAAGCVAAPVPLLSAEQAGYLDRPRAERMSLFKDPDFRRTMKSWGDKPAAVVRRVPAGCGAGPCAWTLRAAAGGGPALEGVASNGVATLGNLRIGEDYELTFRPGPEGGRGAVDRFRTDDRAPRLLDLPGVPNARDFGGWRGLGGRRVRQGLVVRSGGFNENATPKDNPDTPGASRVTDATRQVAIRLLGLKTDVDLRWDDEVFGMTESPLGPDVRWVRCPWSLYQWVAGDGEKAMFARIVRLLLDPGNLPAAVHCIEGQDRTGTLCFLLQGLLGVSDEDKLRDWECTGLANAHWGFRHESRLDPFLAYLATLPGETVNERCEAYARSCGLTDAELAAWRDLMLEP